MFQSVTPCPGKIAFNVEPFPVLNLQVVEEAQAKEPAPQQEVTADSFGEDTIAHAVSEAMTDEPEKLSIFAIASDTKTWAPQLVSSKKVSKPNKLGALFGQ